jgi:DNA-directed RNA polymerase subunit L
MIHNTTTEKSSSTSGKKETTTAATGMNPQIWGVIEPTPYEMHFNIDKVNVSIVNAIRRTILADLPAIVFDVDGCKIDDNNSFLHNEILKERLRAIPVYFQELPEIEKDYYMELSVENKTENVVLVTTEDFKIRHKQTHEFISQEIRNRVFPRHELTMDYILFAKLSPHLQENFDYERINIVCEFTQKTPRENGCYALASTSSYENLKNEEKINQVWKEKETLRKREGLTEEMIEFEKTDFMYLDAQRIFIPQSFIFHLETVGTVTCKQLVVMACEKIKQMCREITEEFETDPSIIQKSQYMKLGFLADNAFDVVLKNRDYTMGHLLEFVLFENGFKKDILTFVAFKKMHPHDTFGILRVVYAKNTAVEIVNKHMIDTLRVVESIFNKISELIKR